MKKFLKIAAVILTVIMLFSPVILISASIFALPSQHGKSYVGYLDEKVDRLFGVSGEKVVVVGGSSVAFALDSELIERELGMPVVNFGLYAALGTKIMLDLSRDAIGEGDIVILSPELDAQTLSMFFSTENTLNAIDDDPSILRYIPSEHWLSMIGGSWRFAAEKLRYFIDGEPEPADIYRSDSFNEYGDIKEGLRKENVMPGYYDRNKIVDLTPDMVDREFINYLNDYIKECESKGATVYFNWCPINKAVISKDTYEEKLTECAAFMRSVIRCEFLGYTEGETLLAPGILGDYSYGPIMDRAYFYDSNFHLNDAGVTYYTINLIDNYYITTGQDKYCDEVLPEPPELPAMNIAYPEIDENEKYFTYILDNTGAVITGLTEEGKKQAALTLPIGCGGYLVSSIDAGAFAGGEATTLVITRESKCQSFGNGAFDGSKISKLYLYQYNVSTDDSGQTVRTIINPPAYFPSGFKIYTPEPEIYKSGYEWRNVPGLDSLFIKQG